jgi:para-nitrobenzyl esterase
VPYVFGTLSKLDRPWTDVDRSLSQTVMSYWANFAAKGDPNGPGLPRWQAYDPQSRTTLELGDRVVPRVVAEPASYEILEPTLRR